MKSRSDYFRKDDIPKESLANTGTIRSSFRFVDMGDKNPFVETVKIIDLFETQLKNIVEIDFEYDGMGESKSGTPTLLVKATIQVQESEDVSAFFEFARNLNMRHHTKHSITYLSHPKPKN